MKKENKGITLIALVVTIIVLLILAGVTISTLTGDNGLLQKASQAKNTTESANEKEKIQVEVAGSYNNKGQLDLEQLKTNLKHLNISDGDIIPTIKDEKETFPLIVKLNENEFRIQSSGNITKGICAEEISNDFENYYGKYIKNYECEGNAGISLSNNQTEKWQIFYADNENIYLIASNLVKIDYLPEGRNEKKLTPRSAGDNYHFYFKDIVEDNDSLKKYKGSEDIINNKYLKYFNNDFVSKNSMNSNNNMRATAYLLDTDIWNNEFINMYAEYSTGGPSLELLIKSYNLSNISNTKFRYRCANNNVGYEISSDLGETWSNTCKLEEREPYVLNSNRYWIISPNSGNSSFLFCISVNGTFENANVVSSGWYDAYAGLRPLVCLKSNVQLIKNADRVTYSLELD